MTVTLESLTAPDVDLGATLRDLSDADAVRLRGEALASARERRAAGNLDAEAAAVVARLLDLVEGIDAEDDRRQADSAEDARIARLAERPARPPAAAPETPAAAPAPEATQPGEPDRPSEVAPEPAPALAASTTPTTGGATTRLRALADSAPPARLPATPPAVITASAGAPDRPGQVIGVRELARIVGIQASNLGAHLGGARANHGLQVHTATVSDAAAYDIAAVGENAADDAASLARLTDHTRLPGGSLTAAGGWCAPSVPTFDICAPETSEGRFTFPTIALERGGILHSTGPDFAAIWTGSGFQQTEAQAIAGTVKPCYDVPCPVPTEIRAEVVGTCVKSGILTNNAYPELVERVLSGALVALDHRINAAQMDAAVALAGAALVLTPAGYWSAQGTSSAVLDAILLQATDLRYRYRLSPTAMVEAKAPWWLLPEMQSDVSKRTGVNLLDVTEATVRSWFAARNIAIEFGYNWQDGLTNPAGGFGNAAAAVAWPTSAEILVYPAGAIVTAVEPLININTGIYAPPDLNTNTYTALFTERKMITFLNCTTVRRITVPTCPSGNTANAVDMDCGA